MPLVPVRADRPLRTPLGQRLVHPPCPLLRPLESSPSLSKEEARRIPKTWIRNSDWFNQSEMELVVGGLRPPASVERPVHLLLLPHSKS